MTIAELVRVLKTKSQTEEIQCVIISTAGDTIVMDLEAKAIDIASVCRVFDTFTQGD